MLNCYSMRHHGVTEGYLPSLKFKVKTIQAMGTEQEELEPDPENKLQMAYSIIRIFLEIPYYVTSFLVTIYIY